MESNKSDLSRFYGGKNVLVTGGLGFIGSQLARQLVNMDAHVTIIDIHDACSGANEVNIQDIADKVDTIIGDIGDHKLMGTLVERHEVLFNLAGQVGHLASLEEPFLDHKANTIAPLIILEACRKRNPKIKIVFTGTRQVYGRPQYLPVDEAHPLVPVDYNGVSKLAGEMYHIVSNRVFGLHTTVLRLTNVFGPAMRVKDDRQTFIGLWFRQLIEGEKIKVFGSGKQTRDLNYVDDVVDALLRAGSDQVADGQIYNVGAGQPISLLDLAQLMIRINGEGSYELTPFPPERKQIDIGDFYADTSKIRKDLDWKPRTKIYEGISKTLEYYKQLRRFYW